MSPYIQYSRVISQFVLFDLVESNSYFRKYPPISLQEVFKTTGEGLSIIVEGKAGSGKTTLLKHCTIRWAQSKQPSTAEAVDADTCENFPLCLMDLVVYVNKSHEGNSLNETIINAIEGSMDEKEEVVSLLREHPEQLFLLVDALDEFRNERVIKEVFELARNWRTNILVSCREGHPHLNDKMQNFCRHVKVSGFEQADAHSFIQKFMKVLLPEDEDISKNKADKICSHINKTKVKSLYISPINCAFICLSYFEGEVTDKELETLTMNGIFEKQQKMILSRECKKQARSHEQWEQLLIDAESSIQGIYKLALHSLILSDQHASYSKKQLEESGIDPTSPALALLVKEVIVSLEGQKEVFSWPHEMVKEFHAAKAVRGTEIIYYIASKPELNVVTKFLVSMLVETDIESAKDLLIAMLLLQLDEPACALSKLKKLFGHCCSKIVKLKHDIKILEIDDLLGIGDHTPQKLKGSLNVTRIQKCLKKTEWLAVNDTDPVTDCIDECTSQDTRTELCRAVFQPFLPSVASGGSAYKVFGMENLRQEVKDLKVYMYPVSDELAQFIFALYFKIEMGKVRDKEEPGVDGKEEDVGGEDDEGDEGDEGDEEDEGNRGDEGDEVDEVDEGDGGDDDGELELKGSSLGLVIDPTLKLDEFTKDSLHQLAQCVKCVDHLILDVTDEDSDITWGKESVTKIQKIFKPKVGVILRKDIANLFTDEDLHALKQDGVQISNINNIFS